MILMKTVYMQTYSTSYKKRKNMFFSLIFSTAVLLSSIECGKFRFANHYADHMVLQRAPYRAVLWGFGENNTFVSISITYQKQIEVLHTEVKLGKGKLYRVIIFVLTTINRQNITIY